MFIEKVIGDLADKRRWGQYKARTKQLPENYRSAVEGFERYLNFVGPGGWSFDVGGSARPVRAERGRPYPIRAVVGEDPVEFIEEFARNYAEDSWLHRERERLTSTIELAMGDAESER